MLGEGLKRAQSGTSLQCSVNHAPVDGVDSSNAERVCENSRFFVPNDGMISVFDTEAVYEAIHRRSGPSAGDITARMS
jgi:hypothetical protein